MFLRPFPSNGAKWQVSRGGGLQPQWRRDGAELDYLAPDRRLVAVPVKAGAAGVTFGTAQRHFDTRTTGWEAAGQYSSHAATADGTRFAVSTATDTVRSITLVLDWTAAQIL